MKLQLILKCTTVFVVLVFFAFQVYNVHLFSDSFEALTIRNIDDAAMQGAISEWHQAIFERKASEVFFKFDYAYGWIFWLIYGLASLPAAIVLHFSSNKIAVESLVIQSNRFTTVLIAIVFLYSFRQVLKQMSLRYLSDKVSNNQIKNYINYVTILVLFSPSLGYWIGRVQPNILVLASITISVLFLIKSRELSKQNSIESKYLLISIVFLSISFASKAVTIYWLPLYFVALYFVHAEYFKQREILFFYKRSSLYLTLTISFSLFFIAPSFVIQPIKTLNKVIEIFSYFAKTTTERYTDLSEVLNRVRFGFADQIIGTLPFVLIILSILAPILYHQRISRASVFLYLYICLVTLTFSFFGPTQKMLIASYSLPSILLFGIMGLFTLQYLVKPPTKIMFALLFGLLMILNFLQNLDGINGTRREALNTYYVDSRSEETQLKLLEIKNLQEIIKLDDDPSIVQSFLTPTAYSSMYTNISVLYVFHNWESIYNIENIDWIVLPKSEYSSDNFFESENSKEIKLRDRSCFKIQESNLSIVFQCKSERDQV